MIYALHQVGIHTVASLHCRILLDVELISGDSQVLCISIDAFALRGTQGLACDIELNGRGLAFVVSLVVEDIAAAYDLVALHEGLHAAVEVALLHYVDGGDDARHYDYGHYNAYCPVGPLDLRFVSICHYAREAQVLDHDEGGQRNEDAVDYEQIQRSADEMPVEGCDTEAYGTQRRHQGSGDGNS